MTKIAALVPLRHHSQRVPGKNYRRFAGKPLFHYILETLLAVPEVGMIAVDTDSEIVRGDLRLSFPTVEIIHRPEHLRADDVSMNDILVHDTAQIHADFFLQTHATNPLLRAETISAALQAYLLNLATHDSLFSVTRLQTRLYDRSGQAVNHDPAVLIQTQDLPPIYQENSCLYIFSRASLVAEHHRIGKKPFMFEIHSDEAWDIDSELDFAICEFLMLRKQLPRENMP